MKTAIVILSVVAAGLAVALFLQWRTIQKLIPGDKPNNPDAPASESSGQKKTARFRDIVNAVQEELNPKEINIKLN
jgi:hypothetical protein